ncbi:stomatin-like protein 1 [Diadema antillarum]|uniref:stomatin-like protein 1 n=1 Tax=Diadema antillarum TaxID=105358 RepID=UPI003A890577
MSQVKYSRLPMSSESPAKDVVAFDFSSVFDYKSVHSYSKSMPPFIYEEKEYKPPVATRVCTLLVVFFAYVILFLTFPLTGWLAIKRVSQFERIVIFRLGRLQSPQGPGVILINPLIDNWRRVDMRTRAFNVPPQQILTADGAAISLGATIYHRIIDVALSIAGIQDMDHAIRNLGQTGLLKLLSAWELSAIQKDKPMVNASLQEMMNGVTQNWGVEVSRVEISEITVIQEAKPPSLDIGKVTNMFTQVAGQVTGGQRVNAQSSPLISLLSLANASQAAAPSNFTAAFPAQSPGPSYQQPQLTVPRQVDTTPSLVEVPIESAMTPAQLLELARPVLDEELVREIGAVYKFVVKGEGGGTYFLDLKTGSGRVGVGEPPLTPDVTLTLRLEDMTAMFEGQLRPATAYMMGRLQLEGDRNVALALESVFARIQDAPS